MDKIRELLEKSTFGVCNYMGTKLGIHASRVRIYFIYLSFVTLGSPIVFYLFAAFWLNVRRYFRDHLSAIYG